MNKELIEQEIQKRLELAEHLKSKSKRYSNWRLFVLQDIRALKRRLKKWKSPNN